MLKFRLLPPPARLIPTLLVLIIFLTFNTQAFAQNISVRSSQVDGDIYHTGGAIGIGTDTINSSALLEINTTEKGILIPRLTTYEMFAIANPANSLLVFNTSKKMFMFYDATIRNWKPVAGTTAPAGGDELWGRASGKNTNTTYLLNNSDKVGIGTQNPTASLEIKPTTSSALKILTSTNGTAANIQFADKDNSNYVGFKAPKKVKKNILWQLPSKDGKKGQVLTTNGNGKLKWKSKKGVSDLWYRNNDKNATCLTHNFDNVGIGISTPEKALQIFRAEKNNVIENSTIRFTNFVSG